MFKVLLGRLINVMPLIFLIIALISSPAFAWNWVGHELVAQIAYDQLTLQQQKDWNQQVKAIVLMYPKKYHHQDKSYFVDAATLPDDLKQYNITTYNTWHYIDIPVFARYFHGHSRPLNPHNILWAMHKSMFILSHQSSSFYTALLIHLVGDAHQPLHCAELYSVRFPQGDRGGNLFLLKHHNLHTYWDQGGGFLNKRLAYSQQSLEATARQLMKKYPPSWFGKRVNIILPHVWVQESHTMAENIAYKNITPYSSPSAAYQRQVQRITQEQIVLAGYRLAALLKSIDVNE